MKIAKRGTKPARLTKSTFWDTIKKVDKADLALISDLTTHLLAFDIDELLQSFLTREFELIFGDEKAVGHAGESVFDERMILAGAQQEADGWVVPFLHHVLLIPGDVGIELADVFMAEFIHFQFHEDMALEEAVVEDEIHKASGLADEDGFLPRFETEPVTQLQEEFLEVFQQALFEIGLGDGLLRLQAQELEDIRIADGEPGFLGVDQLVGHRGEFFLVQRKTGALKIERGNLPLERTHRPISP